MAWAAIDAPSLNAYARARMADGEGQADIAIAGYRQALAVDPASVTVALRAYRQAIESGDRRLALASAKVLDKANALPLDGTLLLTVDALTRKDWASARLLSARIAREENFAFVTPILDSWISIGDGPYAPPAIDASQGYAALTQRYIDEHLALQMLSRKDVAGATPAIDRALSLQTSTLVGLRLTLAARLAALGQKDRALACLAENVPALARARDDLLRGKRVSAPPMTPAQGFARLLSRLGDDISTAQARPVALLLARLASFADPDSAELRLDLVRTLTAQHHPQAALDEAARIPAQGWFGLAVQDARVDALVADGQDEAALAAARLLVSRPDAGAAESTRLANILADADQYDEAARVYRAAGAFYADDTVPWTLYLLEGSALDRGGRWVEARPVLEKAAALAPEEPVVLNYLGYAQVTRRQNVRSALALLEKASALKPNDASITDSLGWARYISGNAHAAVPVLERAALAAPEDVTINEHLGDALWSVGRRYEARYAWSAAGAFAQGAEATRISGKIRQGLLPELAAP
jgi:Flp pilus assembly protein TadD